LSLNGKDKIEVQYSTNSLRGNFQKEEAVTSQTNPAGFIDPEIKAYLAQNQETVVHEDWICEFVRYYFVATSFLYSVMGKIFPAERVATSAIRIELTMRRSYLWLSSAQLLCHLHSMPVYKQQNFTTIP
jgi:hypothetical protein